jgi:acetolactate synthase small subunit
MSTQITNSNIITSTTRSSGKSKRGKRTYVKLDLSTPDTKPETQPQAQQAQPETQVTQETTPVVNIWKLRAEATAVEEALKKAEEATRRAEQANKIAQQAIQATKKLSKLSEKKPAQTEDEDFIPVTTKSYPKKEFKPRRNAEEEETSRLRYAKAFNMAQEQLVNKCVSACSSKARDDINSSITYVVNYRRTFVVDISEDDIVVEVDGETYAFSSVRFMGNFKFQNIVRQRYEKILPDAWINFFPGRDEGTYCIGVQRRIVKS